MIAVCGQDPDPALGAPEMSFLSLYTLSELLVVSLPASVSPCCCAPWQPDSHAPRLEQSPSQRGYTAVPGNSHSTSLERQRA